MANKIGSIFDVLEKEDNTQDQGTRSGLGPMDYTKKGPAASHQAGNPTSGGGINRPTKGKP